MNLESYDFSHESVQFVVEYDSNIVPIDIKKSKGTLNSLEKYKNHNKLLFAIKISDNKMGYDNKNKILTIPFYNVPFLVNDLQNGKINELIDKIIGNN